MGKKRVPLGNFIEEYSVRNKNDDNIPVYSVTNDNGFCIGYFDKEVASRNKTTYKIVPKNFFAYNPSRINVGSIDWQRYEDKVIVSPLYVVFSVCDRLDKQFLYYFLKSNIGKNIIRAKATGSVRDNLKFNMLKEISIPDIDIEQQQICVKILDKVNSIISLRKQQLAALDTLIKARFVEMFGNWQSTAFEVKKLEELCEFIKDGTHNTPTYTNDFITGYRFLSSKDVITGYINWTNNKYIPAELHEKLHSRIAPKRNDLLLAKNGTTGICAIVDTDEIFDIYVSLALLRFLPGINITYMWSAINMPETKTQFDERLKGVGVPNLHLGEIKQTKVIVPPIDLQSLFADFVTQVDKSKFVRNSSILTYYM